MLLLVENNKLITSNENIPNETFEKIMTYSEEGNKTSEYVNIESTKYLYIQKNFKNTNWSVITLIPRNKIIRSTSSLRPIFIGIALVGIVILAVVVRATISAVTRPVEKIVEKLDEYESSEDYEDIEKLSLAMSKIFRYAVKEETVVTLEDELKCISEYMNVMSLRFPDRYEYIVNIDERIKAMPITKMTLQPIIENCFKHGFTSKKKSGKIYMKKVVS